MQNAYSIDNTLSQCQSELHALRAARNPQNEIEDVDSSMHAIKDTVNDLVDKVCENVVAADMQERQNARTKAFHTLVQWLIDEHENAADPLRAPAGSMYGRMIQYGRDNIPLKHVRSEFAQCMSSLRERIVPSLVNLGGRYILRLPGYTYRITRVQPWQQGDPYQVRGQRYPESSARIFCPGRADALFTIREDFFMFDTVPLANVFYMENNALFMVMLGTRETALTEWREKLVILARHIVTAITAHLTFNYQAARTHVVAFLETLMLMTFINTANGDPLIFLNGCSWSVDPENDQHLVFEMDTIVRLLEKFIFRPPVADSASYASRAAFREKHR